MNFRARVFALACVAICRWRRPAQSTAVQAGVLTCRTGPSVGMIVGSVRQFSCVFRPSDNRQPAQRYSATATRIDIGVSAAT